MRDALSGLTVRGRSFLAAGVTAGLCAVLLGQRDLLRIAVLLLALPLVSVAAVTRTRYRLSCSRRVEPPRVSVGSRATVTLRLENVSRLPAGLMLISDQLPYPLGSQPRFVVDRLTPRAARTVTYSVRSDLRGRFPLGPLSMRLTDPFGMCELKQSFQARDFLTVTPGSEALPTVRLGGEWSSNGDSHTRTVASAGEDDVTAREYRHGDDLRRVHWRSTARHGELMVRREEQPRRNRGTVLLDTRAAVHRGEGPGGSLEWAVSAAASIGIRLTHDGYSVRLLTDTGAAVSSTAHDPASINGDLQSRLLDSLAMVTPSAGRSLTAASHAFHRGGGDGLLVAVLGGINIADAQVLARLSRASTTAVAFVLNTASWGTRPRPGAPPPEPTHATRLLGGYGWTVVPVSAADSLPKVWPRATRGAGRLRPGIAGAIT